MDQSSKNNYSAADIERYHSGQMPDAEMHALEKAALDDPFLADALEGYAYSVQASAEIANLKARLAEASKEKKAVPLFFRQRNWMKAAAILLVVAGAAWLIFRNNNAVHQSEMAQQQALARRVDSSKLAEALSKPAATPDSGITGGSLVMLEPGKTRKVEKNTPGRTTINARGYLSTLADKERKDKEAKKEAESVQANANATQKAREITAFSQPPSVQDSVALKDEAVLPQSRSQTSETTAHVDVVMKPLNQPVNEVVINNKAARPSGSEDSKQLRGIIKIDTLEPTGGWVKFDDYIASNIKTPEEVKEKKISGEVLLSFDVDQYGMPQNIKVEKSLCASCDEEAIRLLKEGPKWEKKKNRKGKVKIKF